MMDDLEPIRKSVSVAIGPERAFELFTERMGTWWPFDRFSRAASEFDGTDVKTERLEFEPRAGGSVLEHLSSGQIQPWAEVLVWEPPSRFVLAWKHHPRPSPPTEVEVRFTPEGSGTLVELSHRGWERLDVGGVEARTSYDTGWGPTLARFVEAAGRDVA